MNGRMEQGSAQQVERGKEGQEGKGANGFRIVRRRWLVRRARPGGIIGVDAEVEPSVGLWTARHHSIPPRHHAAMPPFHHFFAPVARGSPRSERAKWGRGAGVRRRRSRGQQCSAVASHRGPVAGTDHTAITTAANGRRRAWKGVAVEWERGGRHRGSHRPCVPMIVDGRRASKLIWQSAQVPGVRGIVTVL